MKVLQIIPSFGTGGAEKVVLNYMRMAKRKNIDMTAISLYPPSGSVYDKTIREEGLNVIYLNKKKGMDPRIVKELKGAIREVDPDIVHTHLYSLKYYVLSNEWRNRQNFHTIHNIPSADASGIDYLFNKFMFHRGRCTPIALHSELVPEVNKYYDVSTSAVIENGIFLDEYRDGIEPIGLRDSLGIKKDDFVIGNIGSFKVQKNHVFMIRLLSKLVKEKSNIRLLLIGDGELRGAIENMVRENGLYDNVIFTGNRSDIPELLKVMNVFILPSLYEGLGIVAIEAQAAGIRCVVSDAVPREVAISDEIDFINLSEPYEKWIKSILKPYEVLHLNSNADKFDMQHVFDDLLNLYKEKARK